MRHQEAAEASTPSAAACQTSGTIPACSDGSNTAETRWVACRSPIWCSPGTGAHSAGDTLRPRCCTCTRRSHLPPVVRCRARCSKRSHRIWQTKHRHRHTYSALALGNSCLLDMVANSPAKVFLLALPPSAQRFPVASQPLACLEAHACPNWSPVAASRPTLWKDHHLRSRRIAASLLPFPTCLAKCCQMCKPRPPSLGRVRGVLSRKYPYEHIASTGLLATRQGKCMKHNSGTLAGCQQIGYPLSAHLHAGILGYWQ